MKVSAIVLRNSKNAVCSVEYDRVIDALTAGGVFLEELVLLPYDLPERLTLTLTRLRYECDCVLLICDTPLLPYAREAIKGTFGALGGDDTLDGEKLIALLTKGAQGEILAKELLLPRIDKKRGLRYSRMLLRTVGAPASLVTETLAKARELSGESIVYNVCEKYGDGKIEAIYHSQTPKMLADDVMRVLVGGLNEYVYSVDDTPLAERVVDALRLRKLRIATAESFTGGGVGGALVRVSGASDVFYEGLNTYANGSKEKRTGVSPYTLKSHGAVSDEVAYEMAAGLLQQGDCEIAVATTGIAGPKSDDTKKPVGLCYIAVGTKERVRVFRFHLEGDREKITKTAINLALFHVYQEIK